MFCCHKMLYVLNNPQRPYSLSFIFLYGYLYPLLNIFGDPINIYVYFILLIICIQHIIIIFNCKQLNTHNFFILSRIVKCYIWKLSRISQRTQWCKFRCQILPLLKINIFNSLTSHIFVMLYSPPLKQFRLRNSSKERII